MNNPDVTRSSVGFHEPRARALSWYHTIYLYRIQDVIKRMILVERLIQRTHPHITSSHHIASCNTAENEGLLSLRRRVYFVLEISSQRLERLFTCWNLKEFFQVNFHCNPQL